MNVRITCPHCNFTTEVPRERIPAQAKVAKCPRCKQRFALNPETLAPLQPAETPPPPPEPVIQEYPVPGTPEPEEKRGPSPWEDRSRFGLWQGAFQTFRDVLFNPINMFRTLHFGQGIKEPLAFGVLFGSLGMMLSMFWEFLIAAWGWGSFSDIAGSFPLTLVFLVLLILTPFIVALLLFIVSGSMHLLLRIVRGGAHEFEATFRVIAYGQATQVFAIIPFLGGFVASLWLLVVEIIGLREIHETSYLRVILAFAIPVVLIFILIIAAIAIPVFIALTR